MIRRFLLMCALALLATGSNGAATAQEPSRKPHKDRACVYACRKDARQCRADAFAEARECGKTLCGIEIEAARTACAEDPASEACLAAREAAHTCLEPCLDKLQEALKECRSDLGECVAQCPDKEPPPPPWTKDPACVSACAKVLRSCAGDERDKAQACRDSCRPLLEAAGAACEEAPDSDECKTARQAAHECLQPCADSLQLGLRTCGEAGGQCVTDCPGRQTSGQPTGTLPGGLGRGRK